MGRAAAADPYRPGPPHALGTFMTTSAPPPVFSSISEVERDVGIAKETLRVWERRYGFPAPQRDPNGERVYPPEQVHSWLRVRRLTNRATAPARSWPWRCRPWPNWAASPSAVPPHAAWTIPKSLPAWTCCALTS